MFLPELTIPQRLAADCHAFVVVADNLSEEQFWRPSGEKWSVADVMQHLYLSARPVARLLTGSRDVLRQWEKPASPSRSYEAIVTDYQHILTTGIKAPVMFSPRPDDMQVTKSEVVERFAGIYQALIDATGTWSEHELDDFTIPHPALGNLTVREMLYFVSVHTAHHLGLLPDR